MFLLCFCPIETLNILLKVHILNFAELSETLWVLVKLCSSQHFTPLSMTEHFLFFDLYVNDLGTLKFDPIQALLFSGLFGIISLVSFSIFGLT